MPHHPWAFLGGRLAVPTVLLLTSCMAPPPPQAPSESRRESPASSAKEVLREVSRQAGETLDRLTPPPASDVLAVREGVESPYGTVAVEVVQPVPYSVNRIAVRVLKGSVVVNSTELPWSPSATQVATRVSMPEGVGSVSVEACAYRGGGSTANLVARAIRSAVKVVPQETATVSLVLTPLFVPAIESLSSKVGALGDQIELTGVNFGMSPEVPVQVLFGGAEASQVERLTDTRIKVAVPADGVTGPVRVVADQVPSADSPPFWVVGNIWLGEAYPKWDTLSDPYLRRYLYSGDSTRFSVIPSWRFKPGEDASSFGPVPDLPVKFWNLDSRFGRVDADGTFTASSVSLAEEPAETSVLATFGGLLVSRCIWVLSRQCTTGRDMGTRRGEIPDDQYFQAVRAAFASDGFPTDVSYDLTGLTSTTTNFPRPGSSCAGAVLSLGMAVHRRLWNVPRIKVTFELTQASSGTRMATIELIRDSSSNFYPALPPESSGCYYEDYGHPGNGISCPNAYSATCRGIEVETDDESTVTLTNNMGCN